MMTKYSSLVLVLLAIVNTVSAQQKDSTINKDVIVVKEYNPTIDDAFKINSTPTIDEVEIVNETFDYSILATPIATDFKLKALDTPPLQKEKSYKTANPSYVRAGIGNYTTLYGDAYYSAFNTEEHNLDFYLSQHSSIGKIKVNGDKEKAPYHATQFQTNYYKGYKTGRLNTKINYERLGYRNYGLQPASYNTYTPKQTLSYSDFDFALKYESMPQKRAHTDYAIGANFSSFSTKEDAKENEFALAGHFITPTGDAAFGIIGELNYYFPKEGTNTTYYTYNFTNEGVANLNPFLKLNGETWNLHLGFKAYSAFIKDQDSKFYIAPDVKFDFDLIEGIFKAYILAEGSYNINPFSSIVKENPFVVNDINVASTREPVVFGGGLSGYLTSHLLFNGGVKYGIVKDQYFYMNTSYTYGASLTDYSNRFDVVYDDGNYFKVFGDLSYIGNKRYNMTLKGSYCKYSLDNLDHAYYMPELNLALSGKYHIKEDIHVSAELTFAGERYGLLPNGSSAKLDNMLDINLIGEYDFTKNISFFGRLHNIAAQHYDLWYGYPSQGFNVLFGAMLKF